MAKGPVDCTLKGQGSVSAEVKAQANKNAQAWVSAYAEAFSVAKVSGNCDTVASAFVEVSEEVFLSAVAAAHNKLDKYVTLMGALPPPPTSPGIQVLP